jgi:hypothetical protein
MFTKFEIIDLIADSIQAVRTPGEKQAIAGEKLWTGGPDARALAIAILDRMEKRGVLQVSHG